jgi:ubiquinone/menaquinone biosynthesis C-methylase UbiE
MNENHAKLCPSPEWAAHIRQDVLPWLTQHAELGEHMLEIGPGPGAATGWLRDQVVRLTVVEVDAAAAARLAAQHAGSNVEVVVGDATGLGCADETFDSVSCFTMLHHVPTPALQNKILAEAFRALRPGGVLIGSDSLPSDDLHHFHADDTYNPVEPASLLTRLQTIGFDTIIIMADWMLKFVARKPVARTQAASDGARPGQQDRQEAPR